MPSLQFDLSSPQVKEIRHRVHGEGFEAWVVYLRVALRMSYRLIVKFTRDLFAEEISTATVERFIKETAKRHEMTERLSLTRMLQSPAIHVDETKINILGIYQQVWVITNGREVLFRLTRTRETNFLAALLPRS